MDPNALSKAFVDHYYSTFDTNRPGLANLYHDASMLTFEGQQFQGAQNIAAKLASLPFQQCQHSITTVDCQPSGPAGGMIVFVSGNLQLAGEQHALKFSQTAYCRVTLKGPLTGIELFHLVVPEAVLDKQRSGSGELGGGGDHRNHVVPFDANTTREFLCAKRHIPLELRLNGVNYYGAQYSRWTA
ncbi:hypothetical protein RHSIM_Rhsim08G0042300 [Rhododendron simsii]|uniref:NTF2 domain-containing protein n=1 Tax=Rhododendron simsii TaxID=118357 RepID=A0A834LEF0_RHOSS|nr:hypothetical protein RHSIM_Rhsim08G0042300 [Rhododendron simsii]